jgi:hypothetical protein
MDPLEEALRKPYDLNNQVNIYTYINIYLKMNLN